MHNSQKPIKNGVNSTVNTTVNSTTNSKINNGTNLNASQRNRIQSDSNNVFYSNSSNVDTDFTTVQHKSKRNLSINSNDKTETIKINKPFFASSNKYAVLANENVETENSDEILIDIDSDTDAEQKVKPPPPIFISGLLDFPALRSRLTELIGADSFFVKSNVNNLKIQTNNADSYRATIHFLKESKAEYHTYQAQDEKPFRVVIRNIHPSTPLAEIGIAIKEIGLFTVRNVSNVLNKTTKNKLPIFFIDLEPAEINKEIFNITSLLNTKIKIEEPYKRRIIIQCTNCQAYGHSKSYCAHHPRCVKCAANHSTSTCTKPKDEPPACALCGGNHTANYRGCQVHKNLQNFQYGKNTPNKKYNLRNDVKYNSIVKKGEDSGAKTNLNPPNINDTSSFPKLSSQSHHPNTPKHTLPNDTENQSESNLATQLSSFISEFKLIINPLISLLTTVINKLIINVN
ncbi:hypothetical protein AGLY_016936 [Aphis glycines]|uniref:Pre-C2HC domain-containing protein n=1 Tax=Aphis glycines TaxID=307491 RepID=A0A6G0SWB8_APHGL|nr:hypothetical protein AGLY_016936 [Aphis glycines]